MNYPQTKKFRKKPVVVEAFQVTQYYLDSMRDPQRFEIVTENGNEVSMLDNYMTDRDGFRFQVWEDKVRMYVPTLEGQMEVLVGDWIITGVKGEKYPCKPDIFNATYESV